RLLARPTWLHFVTSVGTMVLGLSYFSLKISYLASLLEGRGRALLLAGTRLSRNSGHDSRSKRTVELPQRATLSIDQGKRRLAKPLRQAQDTPPAQLQTTPPTGLPDVSRPLREL